MNNPVQQTQNPQTYFSGQRENETVYLKTRRHIAGVASQLWLPIVLIIVGLMISAFLQPLAIVLVPLTFFISVVWGGYIVLEWMNDEFIVTDQRVLKITRTILALRKVKNEVVIESIQEVNEEKPSLDLFARFFNYGDVEIKSAGAQGNFTLDFVHDSDHVHDLILDRVAKSKDQNQGRARQSVIDDIDRWTGNPVSGKQVLGNPQTVLDMPERVYKAGNGPLSPFKTHYKTKDGSVVFRKHWFVWLRAIILPSVWMLAGLIGIVLLLVSPLEFLGPLGWVLSFVAFLTGVVWFAWVDWDWRHDYYHIEDDKISLVHRRPLFLQDEDDQILLNRVQNTVSQQGGIFQQMFGYGNVQLSLLGADQPKIFDYVAHPHNVQKYITDLQHNMQQRKELEQELAQREAFGEYISAYHQRQQEGQQGQYPQQPSPPSVPRPNTASGQPTPSPFGQRPTMSSGRPYTPTSQPPPNQQPQQPATYQQPYPKGQYRQQPQQRQYPQQNPQYQQPQQGQQPQQNAYPQQPQQQEQYPQQHPPPPPPAPFPQRRPDEQDQRPPAPPPPPGFRNNNNS